MADEKDKAQEKKKLEQNTGEGYGSSGGNSGAGKSGQEGMGSHKPEEKPAADSKKEN